MNRLRKILSVEHPPMTSVLSWLRGTGMLLVLMAILLAIILSTVTRDNFMAIDLIVVYAELASGRLNSKASALLAAQNLIFDGRGWINLTDNERLIQREHIVGNVTDFVSTHLEMRNMRREPETSWAWTTSECEREVFLAFFVLRSLPPPPLPRTLGYITMLNPEFPPGATYLQTSVLNMFEVGLSFASLMTFLASPETMPDSAYHAYSNGCDLGESHIAAMNTDFMRGGNGHEILAASVQIGYSQIINSLVAVTETQTNVFIGMILTVGFVAFAIFAPIIIRLDMVADRIMRQFVAIPAPVRKVLFETTSRRMQMLRRDYADSDDDSDDNLDDEEEEPTAGGGGGGASAANKVGGHDDDDDDTGRLSMALHEVTKNGSGGDSDSVDSRGSAFQRNNTIDDAIGAAFRVTRLARKTRLHTKDSSTLIILLLKFISPLLILVILFSSVFATFSQEALKTKTLSAILVSAGVRASCARQAIVDLRKMTSMTVDEDYKDRSFFYTMSSLDCVRTQVRLLGSGNIDPIIADLPFTPFTEMPENGLPSFLSA